MTPGTVLKLKPAYEFHPCSLHVESGASNETFKEIVDRLNEEKSRADQEHTALQFRVGDLQLILDARLGEESWQYLGDLKFSLETLSNCRWVASKIPAEIRRVNLSWSIHREVAHLKNHTDIETALDYAETQTDLTVNRFKEYLRGAEKSKPATSIRIRNILIKNQEGKITLSVETSKGWKSFPCDNESEIFTAEQIGKVE